MRKIIVNADDLGISEEVNARIEECINKGVITSVSIIANAPAFEDGIRLAKKYPKISVGAHLNLVQFKPLTNADIFKSYGIVGQDGQFIMGALFGVSINEELQHAIFDEWDAQISKIEAYGIKPSHCDSHQHTHTITALTEPLIQIMDKHGIARLRRKMVPSVVLLIRKKIYKHCNPRFDRIEASKRPFLSRYFHFLHIINESRRWNSKMGESFLMTNCFYSFSDFYYNRSYLNLGNNSSVVEVMCHPGHRFYQEETNILKKDLSWLPKGYTLVSYNQL